MFVRSFVNIKNVRILKFYVRFSPKKNGRFHLIHHLSSPEGQSVNDGISREDFSLHYITIDHAIDAIMQYGRSAYLFKLDIRSAFRIVPVRQEDWPLLGIHWQNQYYFDTVLPFGLRSSPAIFNSIADCLEWIARYEFSITDLLHYLDDFLCISPSELVANQRASILLRCFNYVQVPLAPDKVEGPAQVLSFLGIELDCGRLEARLPDTKLQDLHTLLDQYVNRGDMTQRELDSLLGKLSFAAWVIIPGRTFMRRLWDICHRYSQPHYKIKLSVEALEDLKWWQRLLSQWNGKSFFHMPIWTPSPDIQLFTDASGSIGWGACYGHRWIQGQWLPEQADYSIEWKEMFAIAAACSSWGLEWRKLRILVYCANEAVVACLSNGCSRSPPQSWI